MNRWSSEPFADPFGSKPRHTVSSTDPSGASTARIPVNVHPFAEPPGLKIARVVPASFDEVPEEIPMGTLVEEPSGGEFIVGEPAYELGGEMLQGEFEPCPHCQGHFSCSSNCRRRARRRHWVRADYLLWNLSGFDIPALVSSSPTGTAQADAGILGLPTTSVLFGEGSIDDSARSGFRIAIGGSTDTRGTTNLEASYFYLGRDSDSFSATGGDIILARPFFSVESGAIGQNAELVHLPGVLEGRIAASSQSDLQGGSLRMYQTVACRPQRSIRLFAGYDHIHLEDQLTVSDFRRALDASLGLAVGTTIAETDQFRTNNRFNGLVLGGDVRACHRRISTELKMAVAIGRTDSDVSLSGITTVTVPTPTGDDISTRDSGLLVLPSNAGAFNEEEFTVIPHLGIDLGFHITPRWSAHLGYELIYWGRVARPGAHIDTNLNLSQIAIGGLNGVSAPVFDWMFTDLTIHAVDFGLDYRF